MPIAGLARGMREARVMRVPTASRFMTRQSTIVAGSTISEASAPGRPIDEDARTMSERKDGSAVVIDGQGVVQGNFTAVDACRALVAVLDRATA